MASPATQRREIYHQCTCVQFEFFPTRFMQCVLINNQLIFLFVTQCVSIIESCQKKAEVLISDLDLHVLVHNAFGK